VKGLEFKRLLYNISALVDLGQEVTSSKDFRVQMRSVLRVIMGTFLAHKGIISSFNRDKGEITPITSKGFKSLTRPMEIGLEEPMVKDNQPFRMPGTAPPNPSAASLQHRLTEAGAEIFVPLWAGDDFMGALILSSKFTEEPYSPEDFELLKVVGNHIAITLHNFRLFMELSEQLEENRKLYEQMRLIYHDTIQAFAAAIDAKDVYTKNHSYRVARYAVAIAKELGWSEMDVEGIYIAGLLHDVGKIVLNTDLLNKKAPLTFEDIQEIKKHPNFSYKIISKVRFPWKDLLHIVKHHHERVDGSGYPDSLTDDNLTEGAKVLTLADSFDAMTTSRPYKRRLDLTESLEEMKRCLNKQFDSKIMAAFCSVLEKEINGELPEPNILPHMDKDFDPSVITAMLQAIREELSDGGAPMV
jgi:putative nucleotidyltransferase with HDIG domain